MLESTLGQHVLLPTTVAQGVIFDPQYIKMVLAYHDDLERPAGTFEVVDAEAVAQQEALERELKLLELSALPRDECPSCLSRKQVYCGDCMGVRMKNAEPLLPERITLPFDVLLLIDWCVAENSCCPCLVSVLGLYSRLTCLYICAWMCLCVQA
jgi:hypothetical protein